MDGWITCTVSITGRSYPGHKLVFVGLEEWVTDHHVNHWPGAFPQSAGLPLSFFQLHDAAFFMSSQQPYLLTLRSAADAHKP